MFDTSKLSKFVRPNEIMASFARQADYDHMVNELIDEGNTLEEAAVEALGCFQEGGYDVSGLYIYNNSEELRLKDAVQSKFKVLEDCALGHNSIINAVFSMQGLSQMIAEENSLSCIMKLAESRKLVNTMIEVLKSTLPDEDDEDNQDNDDEDDDDAEENSVLQKVHVLDFLISILLRGASGFKEFSTYITLEEEQVTFLLKLLDEDMGEPRCLDCVFHIDVHLESLT